MSPVTWQTQPLIYQINTWPWLRELSDRYERSITLADLEPDMLPPELQYFDAVWLMGVWTRSPAGREIAHNLPSLHEECRRNLPDLTLDDLVGSAFSIFSYNVDPALGGAAGIAHARDMLHDQSLLVLLDFVPNHVGTDNPWLLDHPDWFMQGSPAELYSEDHGVRAFQQVGDYIFAHGRDPYFPPWIDTIQVNAFSPGLRQAYIDTLRQVAEWCDGVRCDTAMLLVTRIVQKTWGGRAGDPLPTEIWSDVIPAVKEEHPAFKFIAEVYWDMEWELQQQGFDFCYDKVLYDKLTRDSPAGIRAHLRADLGYQQKLLRFIENHDEPRATAQLGQQRAKAAGLLALTAPGAKLVLEGQLQGHLLKVPVQLGRRQLEQSIPNVERFYEVVLPFLRENLPDGGQWSLIDVQGAWDSDAENPFIGFLWTYETHSVLIVVNYSSRAGNGAVYFPPRQNSNEDSLEWDIFDLFTGQSLTYSQDTLHEQGLAIILPPWGTWILKMTPVP